MHFLFAWITKERQKIRIIYQRAGRHDAHKRIAQKRKGKVADMKTDNLIGLRFVLV